MGEARRGGITTFLNRSALSFEDRAALATIKADLGRLRIKSALRTGYWWLASEAWRFSPLRFYERRVDRTFDARYGTDTLQRVALTLPTGTCSISRRRSPWSPRRRSSGSTADPAEDAPDPALLAAPQVVMDSPQPSRPVPGSAAPRVRHDRTDRQPIDVTLQPIREPSALEDDWQDLSARADHSFFQSWGWIATWLAALPGDAAPLCLRACAAGRTVALGILVPHAVRRHGFVRARGLALHETGRPALDQLTIEHNGLLLDRGCAAEAAAACVGFLADRGCPVRWDELTFAGVPAPWRAWLAAADLPIAVRQESPAPFVDLQALGGGDPLEALSANTRQQVRRSRRLYGDLRLECAGDLASAWPVWEELTALHQASWQARGRPGAFANPVFTAFHKRLIAQRLPHGEIQLLRLVGARGTVGCLYNFVYRGRVYAYQSGFAAAPDNRFKPGLVTHAAAIAWNRAQGLQVYDFLAGDARYKRSLATGATELYWLALQRPTPTLRLERALSRLKLRLRR